MKKIFALLIISSCLMLSACGEKFFINEEEQYQLVRYTKDDIETDTYYIKNGSAFYSTYEPCRNNSAVWFIKDMSLIPDYYKGELIAYKSNSITELNHVSIQRYYDYGYSIGLMGITYENGYGYCNNGMTIDDSNAEKAFSKVDGSLKIETINGNPVSSDSFTPIGSIANLSEGEEVKFELYNGTEFTEVTATADVRFMGAFEQFELGKSEMTKNGYISLSFNDDMKSGYYSIDGQMFRYHDHPRGTCSEEADNPNIAYYENKEEEYSVRYEQFLVSVSEPTYEVKMDFSYDAGENKEEDVRCILLSPDGLEYDIECKDGVASIALDKMIAGKWILNIYPKGSVITNIDITSSQAERGSMVEEKEFEIPDGINHVRFIAEYIGTGEVWGTVEYEDGTSFILANKGDTRDNTGNASTIVDFPAAGKYTMHVYHYNDTAIDQVYYEEVNGNLDEEIIVIEE